MPRPSLLSAAAALLPAAAAFNTTLRVEDPARNRTVVALVCGPDGTASDPLPLYIYGHGFQCNASDYAYLCDAADVVVATPITYEVADTKGLSQDQAFLSTALPRLAASDPSSPLHGRLLDAAPTLGGHSMGGGTTVLAADPAYAPARTGGLLVFAPGMYTNPPALPHAANITVPLAVVVGADDCGMNALPKQALPLYSNATAAPAKALVVVSGADHCQWATPTHGGICDGLDECHAIDRSAQQALGVDIVTHWAATVARSGVDGWAGFDAYLRDGEAAGKWVYTTHATPEKQVVNTCANCTTPPPAGRA